ncbi:MAG: VWA domain-containing protein [Spirochaetaceae bacterium]|jgi:uncharacterized protein with von Willebrand factor type A (vWA) domain|nr:VWA domain-containing protein [Spirochaetaceae bacterium]
MRRLPFNAYINFGLEGSRTEREHFAYNLYASLYNGVDMPVKNTPDMNAIHILLNNSDIREWCTHNEKHAEEISIEILAFIDAVYNYLARETPPYETQAALCNEIAALTRRTFIEAWPDIADYLQQSYNDAINTAFITRELTKAAGRGAQRQFVRIKMHLVACMRRLLDAQTQAWYARVFETRAGAFAQELSERIYALRSISKRLIRDCNDHGRLWNASKGSWQKASYAVLEEYARYAERDLSLRELARSLGRARLDSTRQSGREADGTYTCSASNFEIDGVSCGAALNYMLPQEAGLLCKHELETLFYEKWQMHRLLVFNITAQDKKIRQVSSGIADTPREEEGPFVICIDTSGSMRGAGEKTAKSLVFALLREVFDCRRCCYLISFSTEIAVLELSDIAASFNGLADFLAMSFYGGSRIENALDEALRALDTNAYRSADVVVVSDFVLPDPDTALASRIKAAQAKGTLFHGVLIGSFTDPLVNCGVLELFDTARAYDVF